MPPPSSTTTEGADFGGVGPGRGPGPLIGARWDGGAGCHGPGDDVDDWAGGRGRAVAAVRHRRRRAFHSRGVAPSRWRPRLGVVLVGLRQHRPVPDAGRRGRGLLVHGPKTVRGREKVSWLLIGCGVASWGGGQVLWTVYEVGFGRQPVSPSLCDVGFLLSPLLIVDRPAALRRHPGRVAVAGAGRLGRAAHHRRSAGAGLDDPAGPGGGHLDDPSLRAAGHSGLSRLRRGGHLGRSLPGDPAAHERLRPPLTTGVGDRLPGRGRLIVLVPDHGQELRTGPIRPMPAGSSASC